MIGKIINYIAGTNLFNFIIFMAVIMFLYKKFNVTEKIEQSKNAVKNVIEESENVKKDSEIRLHGIEASLAGIEYEIDKILKKSEESANLLGQKILEDTEKTVSSIKENADKSLENTRSVIKNDIIKRASLASIEAAKEHIIDELKSKEGLHDRLIDESISAIEGVDLS